MKLEQRQETGKHLILCEAFNEEIEGFEEKILLGLKLPHVLSCHLEYAEMKRQWIYDMTGLEPITKAWENKKLTADALSAAILQTCRTAVLLETHMLRQENLLLAPEWVMTAQEPENELNFGEGKPEMQEETEIVPDLYFCIVPGGVDSFQSDAGQLMRFLLQKTDTEREEALRLGFSMFQLSLCPQIQLEQWSRRLLTERKKIARKQRLQQIEVNDARADGREEGAGVGFPEEYRPKENHANWNIPIKNKTFKNNDLQEKRLKDRLQKEDHLKTDSMKINSQKKKPQNEPLLLMQRRSGMREAEETGENFEPQENIKKLFSKDKTIKQKKKVWKKKEEAAQARAESEVKVSKMRQNEAQEQAPESETENSPFLKAAVSIGILTAAFLAVWILRGRTAAMRFVVPYGILCVSMAVFFALEVYRKN